MDIQKAFENYLDKHGYPQLDIKAVLFDMDGVLFDSMKWHSKSWHETFADFEIESTPEEFYLYEGMVGRKTINKVIRREKGRDASEEEIEAIYKHKTNLFNTYNTGDLIPFAYDFAKEVKEDGLTCVLVTGSGQHSLFSKLDKSFPSVFSKELMVTAYDVEHGKPHPEPYLMGLQKAGLLTPNQAIVIENAPKGVESAVAADIFTIAVNTGPIPDRVLTDCGANLVFPSMESLYKNLDEILTCKRISR